MIDEVRSDSQYSSVKCLIFQKKPRKIKNLQENDYDYQELSKNIELFTEYESVESEFPAYLFWSYILENSLFSENKHDIKIIDINLCRPTGGLAVGLLHSMKKHLGMVNSLDSLAFTGSLVSSFGIGYNILGPLLIGTKSLILEHPISNLETLQEAILLAKITTLLIDSNTLIK